MKTESRLSCGACKGPTVVGFDGAGGGYTKKGGFSGYGSCKAGIKSTDFASHTS